MKMSKEEKAMILNCIIQKIEFVSIKIKGPLCKELRIAVDMLKGVYEDEM